jgi:hypothetical protein
LQPTILKKGYEQPLGGYAQHIKFDNFTPAAFDNKKIKILANIFEKWMLAVFGCLCTAYQIL